ncbi:hypothetical protein D3C80_1310440 [compost metagenome]
MRSDTATSAQHVVGDAGFVSGRAGVTGGVVKDDLFEMHQFAVGPEEAQTPERLWRSIQRDRLANAQFARPDGSRGIPRSCDDKKGTALYAMCFDREVAMGRRDVKIIRAAFRPKQR